MDNNHKMIIHISKIQVRQKRQVNTFMRIMSRSSAPAFESDTSTGWLQTNQNFLRTKLIFNKLKRVYTDHLKKTTLFLPHVPSQWPVMNIRQNSNTTRLRANNRLPLTREGERVTPLLVWAKGVLLIIELVHLQKPALINRKTPVQKKKKIKRSASVTIKYRTQITCLSCFRENNRKFS